jgi:hypothetical protein
MDRSSKSGGHRLVALRSIISSHFGQVRGRIDSVLRRAWMEPPHLPTETLATVCARTDGKWFSPVPQISQMKPQTRPISSLQAENPQRRDSLAEQDGFEPAVPSA